MQEAEIVELVEEIFKGPDGNKDGKERLTYSDYMHAVVDHPIVIQFVTGKGGARYGQGIS